MTLQKKGSRTVNVDGAVYRWRPSPMRGYEPRPMLALVTHTDKHPADSTLEVRLYESHCSTLTPEIVASLIRGALAHGWKPGAKGRYNIGPDDASKMLG